MSRNGEVIHQVALTRRGDNTFPVRGLLLGHGEVVITTGTGIGIGEMDGKPGGISYYAAIGILNQNFEPVWMKSFGEARSYVGTGVAVSPVGELVLVGSGNGDVGGEPQGASDVFLGAYTIEGVRLWLTQYGTHNFDLAKAVAVTAEGTIIVVGSWNGDWKHIVYGLPGNILELGESWFIAAHAPDGEMLWMRTFTASDADSGEGP